MAADITSSSNPRIKRLADLRDRKARDLESVFLVEGIAGIERAVDSGHQPLEVYYDPARHASAPFPAEIQLSVEQAALDRASYRGRSQGVIAVFAQFDVALKALRLGSDPLIIVVEAMEEAIQKAARSRYGLENDIRAEIDRRSGDPATSVVFVDWHGTLMLQGELGNYARISVPPCADFVPVCAAGADGLANGRALWHGRHRPGTDQSP